jgi:Ca2+-transporting ATPase
VKFYQKTIEETLLELDAGHEGLTSQAATKRLASDGPNQISIKGEHKKKKIIEPFANVMIGVLVVAGAISVWQKELIDAIIIFSIIIVNASIAWFQQWSTERILRSLRKHENELIEVYRDGNVSTIESENLVRGDVIILHEGQKVPADARVIESDNLHVDESILTGESLSVKKTTHVIKGDKEVYERSNMLFSGSFIVSGAGVAIVTAVGNNTEFGLLAKLAGQSDTKSPVQEKVDKLIKWVVIVVFVAAALAFMLELARGVELVEALRFVLAFSVSAVPESLPIAIMVILVLGMRRMAAKKALVRNMRAIENIGLVTTIATDKTGTLTRNELRVQETWSPRFNPNAFALQTLLP